MSSMHSFCTSALIRASSNAAYLGQRVLAALRLQSAQPVAAVHVAPPRPVLAYFRIVLGRRGGRDVQRRVQPAPDLRRTVHAEQSEIFVHRHGHAPALAARRAAFPALAPEIRVILGYDISHTDILIHLPAKVKRAGGGYRQSCG